MAALKTLTLCAFFCLVMAPGLPGAWAQDRTNALPDSPAPRVAPETPDQYAAERIETGRALPMDFLHDQKQIWLFPTQLARGRYWVPTLAITGVTVSLLYADPHAMPYFSTHQKQLDDLNDVFDPTIAAGEIAAIPVSLLAAGYLRHDSYQVSTALLAADAYADSAVVDLALKAITRRVRPVDVPPGTPFTDTFFNSTQSPISGSGFPSGHATAAFSIATVVALRYHRHRWVPWAAYGFATAVSLSRVTTLAHFPTDVFVGGVLGTTIARYQTLRPR
jgi:membrane-associated phospholipid phosphatase